MLSPLLNTMITKQPRLQTHLLISRTEGLLSWISFVMKPKRVSWLVMGAQNKLGWSPPRLKGTNRRLSTAEQHFSRSLTVVLLVGTTEMSLMFNSTLSVRRWLWHFAGNPESQSSGVGEILNFSILCILPGRCGNPSQTLKITQNIQKGVDSGGSGFHKMWCACSFLKTIFTLFCCQPCRRLSAYFSACLQQSKFALCCCVAKWTRTY